jgi:DNA-binding transcriptional ArsR family regulator
MYGDDRYLRHERALAHPNRVAILDHLEGVDLASGEQIAEAVGIERAVAAYHIQVLRDADLVERVGRMFEKGKTESFYAAATS